MTVTRASGIAAAISGATDAGAAGSSLPARSSVGAVTSGRVGRRSIPAIASQQPAYPSAGVAASMSRTSCRDLRRPIRGSPTARRRDRRPRPEPPARTRLRAVVPGRRRLGDRDDARGDEPVDAFGSRRRHRQRRPSPPSERPHSEARSIPEAIEEGDDVSGECRPSRMARAATGDRPCPRRSTEITRWSRDSAGTWAAHIRIDVPMA